MKQTLKKVGSYRLVRRIGSGATSQVFQAYKQGDTQKYAAKMISIKSLNQNQRQLITKQISIIKSINHPNILKLYDTIITTNNYYLILEYCQKGDLQKYLKKYYGANIPEPTVQKIMFCIGDAIRVIHSKGIVHRDIKLANILVNKDFIIKLADFGFAKEIQGEEFMLKTYCGTPITMAPEILMNKFYDKKCDIWSLGIIMYQLVYGRLPFAINEGYNKFVERVIKQQIKIPSHPQMPQQFKQLLNKCLQKDPQTRYSIEEFMCGHWILQGKDKKLQQRNKQVYEDMSEMLKNISYEYDDNEENGNQMKERNRVIEINTAEKLYCFLKNQVQKIIDGLLEARGEIYDILDKAINSQDITEEMKVEYENMLKLLYYLDWRYLSFLRELKIKVSKQASEIFIKCEDIQGLQLPQFLHQQKKFSQFDTLTKSKTSISSIVKHFLSTNSRISPNELKNDTLQKRKQNFRLIQKYLIFLRSYDLNVNIIFGHHFHQQEIILENVFMEFKEMGRHVSEEMIGRDNGQDVNKKEDDNGESDEGNNTNSNKFDKYSNFVTISMEYKEKNDKLRELRENLKNSCEKIVDEITKIQQGY